MRSKVMNFLQKISKFQINQAYKTGIFVLSHLLKLSRDHCAHDLAFCALRIVRIGLGQATATDLLMHEPFSLALQQYRD
jgi:hypothetical protein